MSKPSQIVDIEYDELPSEAMTKEFDLWNEEYTIEALTDLTVSQIEGRKLLFENREQRLLSEHNPGRHIKENPMIARSQGCPVYTPQQWEEAKKMIRREAERVKLRFDRAKGIVEKEEKESKQNWLVELFDSILPDEFSIR
ncbi:hypothetical protein [Halorubrum salinum]|uniref:hypothetical protein n=1 Tax=Halorubrum salinum TaxID=767517 RepID=UPI0021122D72|nr:hypothetical protein [Halorubrum salinum]